MTQDYVTLFNFNPYKRIIMTTNLIPIQSESIRGSGDGTLKILTDFEPVSETRDVRSVFQYFPTGPYRLTDCKDHGTIRNIDIKFFWQGVNNEFFPIQIPWNSQITMKLAFFNKDMYKPRQYLDNHVQV